MRKILFLLLAAVAISAHGQTITRAKTLKSTDLGNQKLEVAITNGDTCFAILIKTANRYKKHFTVALGKKDEALRLLNFLLDAEIEGDDIIDLENETHNLVAKNSLGGYLVYSEGRAFSGQLRKPNIKGFIKAIEEFCNGKADDEEDDEDNDEGKRPKW